MKKILIGKWMRTTLILNLRFSINKVMLNKWSEMPKQPRQLKHQLDRIIIHVVGLLIIHKVAIILIITKKKDNQR